MTNKTRITPERSAELREELCSLATEKRVDLGAASNKWTMWLQRDASAPGSPRYRIEFMGGAASAAELYAFVLQERSYVFQMLEQVLILEVLESGGVVLRECIAATLSEK
jgi:hypothetical protein